MTNNLKLALRSLVKNKLFTVINIGGLTSGISIALLLFLYIHQELSFDQQQSQKNNLYRLIFNSEHDGVKEKWGGSPNIAGPMFKSEIPEIKEQVRLIRHNFGQDANIRFEDKAFYEKNLYFVDSSFCNLFDLSFIYGSSISALNKPNSIIISESVSKKYFGNLNPLGRVLKIDNRTDCQVTGVYKDLPLNSSIDAELLASITTMKWMVRSQGWSNASFETYLLLNPNVKPETVEKKITNIISTKVPKKETWFSFSLQAFSEMHLESSDISNTYINRTGDKKKVEVISLLTVLILLIAGINYMNLSTAQSQSRYKEIGIAKTLGASKMKLIRRFYLETTLFVIISVIAGILLTILILPYFNETSGASLQIESLLNAPLLVALLSITILLILFSGSYPAFYLSSFNPKNLFNKNQSTGIFAGKLRQGLVIVQFSVSILFIFCTIVLYKQLVFIQEINLGFKPTEVIAIPTSAAENEEQIKGLLNDIRNLSGVNSVCRSQTFPGRKGSGRSLSNPKLPEQTVDITTCRASANVINVLGLQLLAGNTFQRERAETDTVCELILNKTAVEFLGYSPQEAIGKKIELIGSTDEIVGVVNDFHFNSIHQPIGAYAFHNAATEPQAFTLVSIHSQSASNTLVNIAALFKKNLPNSAYKTIFLDEHFNSLYKNEKQTTGLAFFFSVLAILLASLGLFGLSAFMIEQRTKEIGIRKVIGATTSNIIALVSKRFLILIVIASLVTIPFSWYIMKNWLSGFAYHISIKWLYSFLALMLAMLIASLTIFYNALKAAKTNPAIILRKE